MLKKRGRTWWTHHTRPDGERVRRSLKTTDKSAAAILEREMIHKAAMVSAGLVDPYERHKKRPLREHVDDWYAALVARGTTEKHSTMSKARALAVIDGCGFVRWDDVSASAVQQWLADKRGSGASAQTANYYLQAVRGFCRWAVRDRRSAESPLTHLSPYNANADRRRDRRAFSDEELVALFDSTLRAPFRFGMTGEQRSMLYRFATETGLRSSEIRSVRLCDLSLCDGDRACRIQQEAASGRTTDPPVICG